VAIICPDGAVINKNDTTTATGLLSDRTTNAIESFFSNVR
jgi:hypothetical protein